MNKIKILPDFIANQIAAGEVVQRPASVIKELVENSIDAEADSIAVIVRNAGKKLIHVVDNGLGMDKDDLQLSVKRHATSKIVTQDDLENILTYGFRGEALASISSVALVEIRTKTKNDKIGLQLLVEPNKEIEINPVNADTGTQVFVKNLFYNVPARRKFLRTDMTEFRHISDVMLKFALSNPHIRFTFYDDDTLIFDVHNESIENRINNLFGESHLDYLMKIDESVTENDEIKISGFVGQPQIAKQSKSGQFLFLNKRAILSKSLSHAVFSAFEQLLEKNQQPSFIINLEINPKKVDVNVHPQKNEVKFEDERYAYNLLKNAVKQTLKKYSLVPTIDIDLDNSQTPFDKVNTSEGNDSDILMVNKMTGEIIENKAEAPSIPQSRLNFDNEYKPKSDKFDDDNSVSAFDELFGLEQPDRKNEISTYDSNFLQIHNKYIVYQSDDGMTIIDQHNAHERILYEKAIKAMNKEFKYSQELLFPSQIKLSPNQLSLLKELKEDLNNLGYVFSFVNEDKIEINSVPNDIKSGNEKGSILELIEQYEEYSEIRHTDKRDNIAASYSCKSAIKTGKSLSAEEMKKLKDDLFNCKLPYVCPHGRPVVLEFKISELDNKFGRAKDLRF